jgi:hypothetical protein
LLEAGFTLEQVIRDYGDVCQAVTSLASETEAPIYRAKRHPRGVVLFGRREGGLPDAM